jgi:hypothetical protein
MVRARAVRIGFVDSVEAKATFTVGATKSVAG